MSIYTSRPLFLSDGTPVSFVKTTSRGNIQVRIPANHALARGQGNGRLFDPYHGRSTKGSTSLTLSNNAPVITATTAMRGPVNARLPLYLSDGTAVSYVKTTARGRIQVRLPYSHPLAAGQENGLLFEQSTGTRYKNRDPRHIFLTNTAPASAPVASRTYAAPAAPAPATSRVFKLKVAGRVLASSYPTYSAAESAAYGRLSGTVRSVEIVEVVTSSTTTTTVVGTVAITTSRR